MTELNAGQRERHRLEQELARLRLTHPFPTPKGIAAHEAEIADLQKRLQGLPPLPRELPAGFLSPR